MLGLPLIAREHERALLGADAAAPGARARARSPQPTPLSPHSTGLFHVAWLHPSRAALAETVRRIAGARWPIDGASDHGVSEALYLSDPDGLGHRDLRRPPARAWQRPPDGHGVRMVTLPLDLDDLLAQAPGEPPAERSRPARAIGHVHLKVADVPRALAFYRDALGLEEQAQLPSAAFLSAGGYHHHIGLNSWQSRGRERRRRTARRGLREIGFELGARRARSPRCAQSLAEAPRDERARAHRRQRRCERRRQP